MYLSQRDEISEFANRIIESRDLSLCAICHYREKNGRCYMAGVWKFHLYRTTAPIGKTNVAEPGVSAIME